MTDSVELKDKVRDQVRENVRRRANFYRTPTPYFPLYRKDKDTVNLKVVMEIEEVEDKIDFHLLYGLDRAIEGPQA
jgi:hypothetical protein